MTDVGYRTLDPCKRSLSPSGRSNHPPSVTADFPEFAPDRQLQNPAVPNIRLPAEQAIAAALQAPARVKRAAGGQPDILRALENRHRWLLFAQHCYTCSGTEADCELGKLCTYGKKTLKHVAHCKKDDCSYQRCRLLKPLLQHSQRCQSSTCAICVPVWNYIQKDLHLQPQQLQQQPQGPQQRQREVPNPALPQQGARQQPKDAATPGAAGDGSSTAGEGPSADMAVAGPAGSMASPQLPSLGLFSPPAHGSLTCAVVSGPMEGHQNHQGLCQSQASRGKVESSCNPDGGGGPCSDGGRAGGGPLTAGRVVVAAGVPAAASHVVDRKPSAMLLDHLPVGITGGVAGRAQDGRDARPGAVAVAAQVDGGRSSSEAHQWSAHHPPTAATAGAGAVPPPPPPHIPQHHAGAVSTNLPPHTQPPYASGAAHSAASALGVHRGVPVPATATPPQPISVATNIPAVLQPQPTAHGHQSQPSQPFPSPLPPTSLAAFLPHLPNPYAPHATVPPATPVVNCMPFQGQPSVPTSAASSVPGIAGSSTGAAAPAATAPTVWSSPTPMGHGAVALYGIPQGAIQPNGLGGAVAIRLDLSAMERFGQMAHQPAAYGGLPAPFPVAAAAPLLLWPTSHTTPAAAPPPQPPLPPHAAAPRPYAPARMAPAYFSAAAATTPADPGAGGGGGVSVLGNHPGPGSTTAGSAGSVASTSVQAPVFNPHAMSYGPLTVAAGSDDATGAGALGGDIASLWSYILQ